MNNFLKLISPQDKWKKLTPKQKKLFFITILVISSIVIFVTLAFVFSAKSKTEKNIESETYNMIADIVTVNDVKPASLVVAPATQDWWDRLLNFSANEKLASLEYETISQDAIYIAYTVSSGGQYEEYTSLGVPTTFVVYENSDAARAAGSKVDAQYDHFVRANILLLTPFGSFTDVDYSLDQFNTGKKTIKKGDLELNDEAMWQINMVEFETVLAKNKEAKDIEVYKKTLKNLGVTKKTSWTGFSSDGFNWNGKISEVNVDAVKSPSEIVDFLISQRAYVLTDGTLHYGEVPPEENRQTGIIEPRQGLVADCCMIISSNQESAGSLLAFGATKYVKGEKLSQDEGILKFEMFSNQWFALMMGQKTAYPVSNFDKVTLLVKDTNGNSTITLSLLENEK